MYQERIDQMDGDQTESVTTPTPVATPIPPTAAPIVVPPTPPATGVQVVTMSLDEYQKHRTRLDELDRRLAEEERKSREANERAIERQLESGKWKEALDGIRQTRDQDVIKARQDAETAAQIERERLQGDAKRVATEKAQLEADLRATQTRAQKYAMNNALSQALAAHNLVEGGAEQLGELWGRHITAQASGDSFAVTAATGQTVQEFVAEQLASPKYKHFNRAGVTQGGPLRSPAQPAPAQEQPAYVPPNMGWAAIADVKSLQKGVVSSATNMNAGFGLRAIPR